LRCTFIVTLMALFFYIAPSYADDTKLSSQPEVQNFIRLMVDQYQFDANNLAALLDSTPLLTKVIENIQHPYEEQPWYIYRSHLVSNKRITAGLAYWKEHKSALKYAEKQFGVPASIIVAIVGIESFYGKIPSKYPVLNSLVTLSFYYQARADFFQKELEQYLLLTRDLNIDPRTVLGSYAGAIGLPQFMPSNYRKYALEYKTLISGENNTQTLGDLMDDTDDVIVSVANFLQHFGWEKKKPIAVRAKVKGDLYNEIIAKKLTPTLTIAQLKKYGVTPMRKIPKNHKAMLIELQDENNCEYWLGFDNFHVLSHYNGDKQYIMAVYQLAVALKKARR